MTKPEVLIDGVVFENDSQIGIWRLFYEVMTRTRPDISYTLLLSNKPIQPVPDGIAVCKLGPRYDPVSRKQLPLRLLGWPYRHRVATRHPSAIWHSTFYGIDPRPSAPKVVTVYDMIAERCYSIGPYVFQRQQKARALASADAVLAISQATATELSRFYPGMQEKIRVMHLGREHLIEGCDRQPNSLLAAPAVSGDNDVGYCLFVGGRYSYKNFVTVVEALSLPEWPAHLKLVVVGAGFDEAEQALIRAMGVERRIRHVGKASYEQLQGYYSGAKCFLFPSLMEGFGIPILEAQSLGVVPVLSDTRVFREIAGEGAIFFNGHSPVALANAVERSLQPSVRNTVVAAGTKNCSRFSWDEAAKITMECYQSLWRKSPSS